MDKEAQYVDQLIDNESTTKRELVISTPDPQVKVKTTRRKFTTAYKRRILKAYDACQDAAARGALLRREALYHSRITAWRNQLAKVDNTAKKKTPEKSPSKSNHLQRENSQLKKKLAQAEAIIALQKKVSELLGNHILPQDESETMS